MSTPKHTPGPWAISERKDGLGSLPNRNSLEIVYNFPAHGGQQVIVGKHTGIDCLTMGNANLIAAAPAMYEALSELVKYLREQVSDEALDTWEPVFKAAKALAQAEGTL